jgi:hypothetical protein
MFGYQTLTKKPLSCVVPLQNLETNSPYLLLFPHLEALDSHSLLFPAHRLKGTFSWSSYDNGD